LTASDVLNVLLLPGWLNSGPSHWQSLWQATHGYQRVEQHDWERPLRGDWIARLEDVVLTQSAVSAENAARTGKPPAPLTLVAHSLGCLLVAAWAAHSRNTHLVQCAMLVAPGDVEREELRPVLTSWSPVAMQKLPFKSVLLGSRNDPYCSLERAQTFGQAWGADWVDYGECGHINGDSGLGAWADGHNRLLALQQQAVSVATAIAATAAALKL
jgi:predicted alpha/beta hydrolase family esterase